MHDGAWRRTCRASLRLSTAPIGSSIRMQTSSGCRVVQALRTLAAIPLPYGIVFGLSRHFVPRPDDGKFFAERMTVRLSPLVAINDPTSPYRPHPQSCPPRRPRCNGQSRLALGVERNMAGTPQLASGGRSPLSVSLARSVGEQRSPAGARRQPARPVRHRAPRVRRGTQCRAVQWPRRRGCRARTRTFGEDAGVRYSASRLVTDARRRGRDGRSSRGRELYRRQHRSP